MIPSQKVTNISRRGAISTLDAVLDRIIVPASVSRAEDVLQDDMAVLASMTGAAITVAPPATYDGWGSMVLRQGERIGADLIGIPAPKRGVWHSLFLDPDVRFICSQSAVPVWMSGDKPVLFREAGSERPQIVCAVDLQEGSDSVIYFANRLATAISTGIAIVYVMPDVTDGTLAASLLEPDIVLAQSVAQDRLKILADHCTNPVDTHLLHGISGPEINQFVAEMKSSAIILTGRKTQGRLGATASRLLRRSRCPVVIAPIS